MQMSITILNQDNETITLKKSELEKFIEFLEGSLKLNVDMPNKEPEKPKKIA